MAEDIKQEMNSTPGCIPSKWNRNTVADGDWLQKYTLAPLSSRDNFLADKISGTEFNLDEEIRERKAGDSYLSGAITSVSSDFYTFSGDVCVSAENLSAALKEEIRIRGEQDYNLSQQIIGEKSQREAADNKLQKEIDKLEAATDVIMVYADYNEFTVGSAYLVEEDYLTDADVIKVLQDETSGSKQIYYQWYDPASGHEWSGWSAIGSLEPYYSIADMDRILAYTVDNISATVSSNYLSANDTAVKPGHNIKITNPDAGKPYIKIETSSHVTFDGVSSTNLSATNASGTSSVYSNISSTNLIALTATGTSAKFTTVSGASGIFTSGKIDTGNILTAYGSSAKFDNISSTNLTALTASGSKAEFGTFVGTFLNNTIISNLISSAEYGKDAWDKISTAKLNVTGKHGNNVIDATINLSGGFGFSAGDNLELDVVDNTIKISGTPAGITSISSYSPAKLYTDGMVTFSAGNEITFTTANDKLGINASTNLINSAHDGSAAYNILTSQSATITNGPGILFYNDDNKLGIKVDVRGVSNTITGIGTSALSAGDNYQDGRCISISNDNKINLDNDISVDELTATKISNDGNDLSFINMIDGDGDRTGEIYAYKTYYSANNRISDYNISGITISSHTSDTYTYDDVTTITENYFEMIHSGYNNAKIRFNTTGISAGPGLTPSNTQWNSIINVANGTWVSGSNNGIAISAPTDTKIVFTGNLPSTLVAGTYYII